MPRLGPILALGLCAAACTDLDSYAGSYQGTIVGTEGDSFIRRGFPAGTRLVLRDFDPPPAGAGPIATLEIRHGDARLLLEGTLDLIAPLEHDQLSLYDFPGGGRVRNFIFAVAPTGGEFADRTIMAFVSLMDDDKLEVRLISGKGDEAAGDLFGLFIVGRQ